MHRHILAPRQVRVTVMRMQTVEDVWGQVHRECWNALPAAGEEKTWKENESGTVREQGSQVIWISDKHVQFLNMTMSLCKIWDLRYLEHPYVKMVTHLSEIQLGTLYFSLLPLARGSDIWAELWGWARICQVNKGKGWGWDEGQTSQAKGTVRPKRTEGHCTFKEPWAAGGGGRGGVVLRADLAIRHSRHLG